MSMPVLFFNFNKIFKILTAYIFFTKRCCLATNNENNQNNEIPDVSNTLVEEKDLIIENVADPLNSLEMQRNQEFNNINEEQYAVSERVQELRPIETSNIDASFNISMRGVSFSLYSQSRLMMVSFFFLAVLIIISKLFFA